MTSSITGLLEHKRKIDKFLKEMRMKLLSAHCDNPKLISLFMQKKMQHKLFKMMKIIMLALTATILEMFTVTVCLTVIV